MFLFLSPSQRQTIFPLIHGAKVQSMCLLDMKWTFGREEEATEGKLQYVWFECKILTNYF